MVSSADSVVEVSHLFESLSIDTGASWNAPNTPAQSAGDHGPAGIIARKFRFSDLASATEWREGPGITIVDQETKVHRLPLGICSNDVQEAVLIGLQSAIASTGQEADWSVLHDTLQAELWGRPRSASCWVEAVAGGYILEVFEVERRRPASGGWWTSTLPTDRELKWRWVDASGKRHPHLLPGLSCSEAASIHSAPPCEPLSRLFQAVSEWEITRHESTDDVGWSYSITWNSSVWYPKPSLLDTIRKRRWTRAYA